MKLVEDLLVYILHSIFLHNGWRVAIGDVGNEKDWIECISSSVETRHNMMWSIMGELMMMQIADFAASRLVAFHMGISM